MKPAITTPAHKALSLNVVARVKAAISRDNDSWQHNSDFEFHYPIVAESIDRLGNHDYRRMRHCFKNKFFKNYTPVAA